MLIKDRLSFAYFLGLGFADPVPDAKAKPSEGSALVTTLAVPAAVKD